MADPRPPIPAAIKREVRQRCRFCCIRCRAQIYEYHHIDPYERVLRHEATNLTLLCPNCHTEATSGILPAEDVRRLDEERANADLAVIPRLLGDFGRDQVVILGNNRIAPHDVNARFVAIAIDEKPLIWFTHHDAMAFLNVELFDENNELLVQVIENELVYRVDTKWDIEVVGKRVTFRSGPRRVFLEIEWDPPRQVAILRGLVLFNGIAIAVSEHGVMGLNAAGIAELRNCDLTAACGVNVGRQLSLPSALGSDPVNRYAGIDLTRRPEPPPNWASVPSEK